jgi:hypothetical protein
MDIYQILEAIKGVEESAMKQLDAMFNDWINSEDCPYNDMAGDDRAVMGCAYRYLDGKVDPSKIEDYAMALTHAFHGGVDEGFTGYWKGTDAGTPGKKMVGADESVEQECDTPASLEDRLRSRWEQTKREKGLQEYGMTTGGTQNPTAQTTPADLAKQTNNVQQGVNKLKSAGVNIPSGSQAVQSLMKDPVKDPVSQLDKTVDAGLGQEVQNIVTKGQPNDVNQLAALIKKVNQSSGV